jgi:SAM-dependent methyltransferase
LRRYIAGRAPRAALGRFRRSTEKASPTLAVQEGSLWVLLRPYLPEDHARQVSSRYYIDVVMQRSPAPRRVMDLGCGTGGSIDLFRRLSPEVDWVGVDIADSQEASQRRRTDATFVTYDGTKLPFPDRSFDVVYSSQVLEHVVDPLAQMREIARILSPGGSLIGSTSQLEPYHSRSYWNYSPLGFVSLVNAAGMDVEELRPGIDGVTLILRSFFGRPGGFAKWWDEESPLNSLIDEWAQVSGRSPALVNLRKLQFAGQFSFLVRAVGR